MKTHLLEVCVDSLDGLRNALVSGADRIELCRSLDVGGMSPSLEMVSAAMDVMDAVVNQEVETLPLQIMVRPVEPSFEYAASLLSEMVSYIDAVKKLNDEKLESRMIKAEGGRKNFVSGFVFGCLSREVNPLVSCIQPMLSDGMMDDAELERGDWAVDEQQMKSLIDACKPYSTTFHRAFDEIADKEKALKALWELGVDRILTSGGSSMTMDAGRRTKRLYGKARSTSKQEIVGQINSPLQKSKSSAPGGHFTIKLLVCLLSVRKSWVDSNTP